MPTRNVNLTAERTAYSNPSRDREGAVLGRIHNVRTGMYSGCIHKGGYAWLAW